MIAKFTTVILISGFLGYKCTYYSHSLFQTTSYRPVTEKRLLTDLKLDVFYVAGFKIKILPIND